MSMFSSMYKKKIKKAAMKELNDADVLVRVTDFIDALKKSGLSKLEPFKNIPSKAIAEVALETARWLVEQIL